jgi:hypothetical protein
MYGERIMKRIEAGVFGLAVLGSSSPAFAGTAQVPAPVAGVGIGAVVLIGLGYRALKGRISR